MPNFNASPLLRSKSAIAGTSLLLLSIIGGDVYLNSADKEPQYPRVIQADVEQGMLEVVRSFPAPSGLTGWVLSQAGQHSIAYTTQDGETLLAGMLISEEGKNLSAEHEAQFVPKPDFTALYSTLEQSAYIAEGELENPKKIIYAFTDANCPYCHRVWKALQPYEKVGLQVRWLQVAILGPTSMTKAIEVMSAADKPAAFAQLALDHGKPWAAKAEYSAESQPEIAEQIRSHAQLMGQFNIAATPGMIWKDAQGKLQVKVGMPRLSELPAITGLAEQATTDPALLQYQ
ncbi:thiol:disulfide interchange protein DsbG [Chitinibacter sp. FCG-7]|uniref:Thiol:disulfide interchange protein n=1 Tax=Chitinibacter mangrovi TaxID=3153927 RepID=A0AAU7FE08_9NEIS